MRRREVVEESTDGDLEEEREVEDGETEDLGNLGFGEEKELED